MAPMTWSEWADGRRGGRRWPRGGVHDARKPLRKECRLGNSSRFPVSAFPSFGAVVGRCENRQNETRLRSVSATRMADDVIVEIEVCRFVPLVWTMFDSKEPLINCNVRNEPC